MLPQLDLRLIYLLFLRCDKSLPAIDLTIFGVDLPLSNFAEYVPSFLLVTILSLPSALSSEKLIRTLKLTSRHNTLGVPRWEVSKYGLYIVTVFRISNWGSISKYECITSILFFAMSEKSSTSHPNPYKMP
jgi:hypothetical protein